MSEHSPLLSLPYIQPAQAQKHVTHNEALRVLDVVAQLAVTSADQTAPPAAPLPEARFIVASPATGDWAGQEGNIALYDSGVWRFFTPVVGWHADNAATGEILRFDGTNWVGLQQGPLQNIDLLGIQTTADTTNRLAVSSDATLFTHDGTDHRIKVNKDTAPDTASLLFQTGFSGRAEMGVMGSDDFSIKVSPDGSTFFDGMTVNGQTGEVTFPNGSTNIRERLTGNRIYYVRTDGSNSNTGLSDTPAGAFQTIQYAIDVLMALDCGIFNVSIFVGQGNYGENINISGSILGSGAYRLQGDPATPTNVKVGLIRCEKNLTMTIDGFEFTATNGFFVRSYSQVTLGNARFSGSGTAITVRDGFIDCNHSVLQIGSSIKTIANLQNYANLSGFQTEFVLDPNITWGGSSAFFLQSLSNAWLFSALFLGATSSCSGSRYNINLNSVLNTVGQGPNFIPGTIQGFSGTGAQYA